MIAGKSACLIKSTACTSCGESETVLCNCSQWRTQQFNPAAGPTHSRKGLVQEKKAAFKAAHIVCAAHHATFKPGKGETSIMLFIASLGFQRKRGAFNEQHTMQRSSRQRKWYACMEVSKQVWKSSSGSYYSVVLVAHH